MRDMRSNILGEKSFAFALRIVNLYKYLCREKGEYVLSKQLLRAGTAVGAMQSESEHAESEADFIHKLSVAQKECNEALYWLRLLRGSNYLDKKAYDSIFSDAEELKRILTSILKTLKMSQNLKKGK